MDIKTKEKLVTLYQAIPKKTKAVCLKYRYLYNGVNVNIYFDAFDKKVHHFASFWLQIINTTSLH